MIKNFSILTIGVLIGMGAMFLVQLYQDLQQENSSLRMSAITRESKVVEPELKLDPVIEKLVKEELEKSKKKPWFAEKLKKLEVEGQLFSDKLRSEGEDAAKVFKQFSSSSPDDSSDGE